METNKDIKECWCYEGHNSKTLELITYYCFQHDPFLHEDEIIFSQDVMHEE